MTSPRIPTHQPGRAIAQLIVLAHGRRMLCLATDDASHAAMTAALATIEGDYRYSWQDGPLRHHQVKQRGTVTRWTVDHRPVPLEQRLHAVEADADRFEPMDERVAA